MIGVDKTTMKGNKTFNRSSVQNKINLNAKNNEKCINLIAMLYTMKVFI